MGLSLIPYELGLNIVVEMVGANGNVNGNGAL